METIKLIPIEQLYPHPENPRKDLGDLSELSDSIKANGIFQNLTVVPWSGKLPGKKGKAVDGYRVIIGHRRMAAAKLAGVSELPCAVVEMTEAEQVRTMLMENMQRSDLTVYEQAQGFQLMLDMGGTVESVAKDTGFSEATVRRRVKLLELDPEKFKKSEARGATLQDYMELDKIEDPELKNEVLDKIGTANFRDALKKAIGDDKLKKRMAQWEADVSAFATKIEKRGHVGDTEVPMDYHANYHRWRQDAEVERPTDSDTVKYYYTISDTEIYVYKDHQEQPETQADIERKEREREFKRVGDELEEITKRHFALRSEFVSNFGAAKRNAMQIMKYAAGIIVGDGKYRMDDINAELLAKLLDLDIDEDTTYPELRAMVEAKMERKHEYVLLACAYASCDYDENQYWRQEWDNGAYHHVHQDNDGLDRLYDFLISLGYEMSDEEKAMRDGTHELLNATPPDTDPCKQCKSTHPYCDKCCKTCEEKCNGGQICHKKDEGDGDA